MSADNTDALGARDLPSAINPSHILQEHKKFNNGKVKTRFPPEPNGYLHIGHAKSMNMNFQMAFEKLAVPLEQRQTIFRYDDTNPEAESKEYIDSLAEDVAWLGWVPFTTTFTSDYFDKLYDLAIELIKKGKAYVCHQTQNEIMKSREICKQIFEGVDPATLSSPNSPWRDRSVEENLKLFEDMRRGKFSENEATLRMKMDMRSPNPNMWDQVAYRIKYIPHPHAGDKWCIYPTYDYTHCIIDSLEHIDYSICTLEFETRRESYYWVLEMLDLYRPNVYEFARLNITYTQLSKRKLLKMVKNHIVRGWDDPRMPTIKGLRRRGYTPDVLNAFCRDIGVTRNENMIQYEKLQSWARQILHDVSVRAMAVLEPIRVVITNLNESKELDVPDFPFAPERGSHKVTITPVIYINSCDFRTEKCDDYFGLTPDGDVILKYAFAVHCDQVEYNENGKLITVFVTADFTKSYKPKGTIQWVPENSLEIEVRLYDHMFINEKISDNWEDEINSNSEIVIPNARVDPSVAGACPETSYQFERIGFFVVDKDSSENKLVFNLTVNLKEASSKKNQTENEPEKSRKDEQARQKALKEAKSAIDPNEMYRIQTDLYSQFDEEGIPTHDIQGNLLSKNAIKKLKKDQDKQKKLFEKSLTK